VMMAWSLFFVPSVFCSIIISGSAAVGLAAICLTSCRLSIFIYLYVVRVGNISNRSIFYSRVSQARRGVLVGCGGRAVM
jgi:hypothetical protein